MNTRTITIRRKSAQVSEWFLRGWILIIFALLLMPARSEPTQPSNPNSKLRVITYNVFVGFKDDAKRHAQAVDWIAAQQPDVVALQELNGYTKEKLTEDARAWGHPHSELCITRSGYHLGITSRKPITNVQLIVKPGINHGMIHGQTHGIDFFVLHLAPQSEEIRLPETEIILAEIRRIQSAEHPRILLGDFNSSSPLDAEYFRQVSKHDPKFDVMTRYLNSGYVDLVNQHNGVLTEKQASVPTLLVEKNHGFWRLDYILISSAMAKMCVSASVVKCPETDFLSDHYPIVADFNRSFSATQCQPVETHPDSSGD